MGESTLGEHLGRESKAALYFTDNINALHLVIQKCYSHYNFMRLVEKVIVFVPREQKTGGWIGLVES